MLSPAFALDLPVAASPPVASAHKVRRAPPPELRLLTQGLGERELITLNAFVRLGEQMLQSRWTISQRGHADLLLYGDSEPATVPGLLDDPAEQIFVGDTPAAVSGAGVTLSVPLQYETVMNVLRDVEARLLGAPNKDEARAGASDPEARRAASAPRVPTMIEGASYRLRRWPPGQLLHQGRYHMRLAACLSARALTVEQLARAADAPVLECREFVGTLLRNEVLRVQPPATSPAQTKETNRGAAPKARAATWAPSRFVGGEPVSDRESGLRPALSVESGAPNLFQRIRVRLGLR